MNPRIAISILLAACSDERTQSDAATDASSDIAADGALICDPKIIMCPPDEGGVFVSPIGADSNDGSKTKPVATIAKGLTLAASRKPILYVCAGTYMGSVTVASGVQIYGGYDCASWWYNQAKTAVQADQAAFGMKITADNVAVFDLEIDAKDGVPMMGETSVAVFASGAQKVTLTRLVLKGGKGSDGSSGTKSDYNFPLQTALNGKNAMGADGGAPNAVTCPGGLMTTGGKGGDNGFGGDNGLPALGGGQGGTAGACGGTGIGKDGNNATPGADAPAVGVFGALSTSGWTPASGAKGTDGGPGQGGGGGYGQGGGGGGGGGAGGCGGVGGGGGQAGGGSIAIAVIGSNVALNACTLTTTAAGNAGSGIAGQTGQTLFGFGGLQTPPACTGGNGGTGSKGGAGAGGAGGISVGVLYKDMMPTLDAMTMAQITLGAKGNKGSGGAANDGVDGVAQAVLQAP